MSISILSGPSAIASAYRPLIYKVSSTVTTPEIQIRADIWVKNSPSVALSYLGSKYEKKYMDHPYFIFDLSNAMRSMLSLDRLAATQAPGNIVSCPGSVVIYNVKFTEVYYDADGLPADYLTLWSGELKAVNSIPQHDEDQSLTNYILFGDTGDSFSNEFSEEFA